MKRLLLLDDYPIMEAAVGQLLATSFAGTKCVAVFSLEEATNALRAQHFDLILLDIAVAGCDPIGIIHIFRALQPRIPVLVFTRLDENVHALPFTRSGGSGFFATNAPTEEITHALPLALSHRRVFVSPSIQEKVLTLYSLKGLTGNEATGSLSEREFEIIGFFSVHMDSIRIGEILGLTPATIAAHKKTVSAEGRCPEPWRIPRPG